MIEYCLIDYLNLSENKMLKVTVKWSIVYLVIFFIISTASLVYEWWKGIVQDYKKEQVEKMQPSDFIEYASIYPKGGKGMVGADELPMISQSVPKRKINIVWHDFLFCDEDEDGIFRRFSDQKSDSVFVEPRLEISIAEWTYKADLPNEPMKCKIISKQVIVDIETGAVVYQTVDLEEIFEFTYE